MNGLLKINWTNIKSAIIYGLMTLVTVFFLNIFVTIIDNGTIFGLDWASVIDRGIVAALPTLVFLISIVKNLLTNNQGEFLGITEVVANKE